MVGGWFLYVVGCGGVILLVFFGVIGVFIVVQFVYDFVGDS